MRLEETLTAFDIPLGRGFNPVQTSEKISSVDQTTNEWLKC